MILLLACASPDDTGKPDDTGTAPVDDTLVVATVASDFSAGQLATVRDGVVTDGILPTSTDPVVEADGEVVFLLDRSSENTLRMYLEDWSVPVVELSTGDGTNPQDAARCGKTIVASVYTLDHLLLFDATTGLPTGTVDLSEWSDADGAPEADSITRGADGHLYVALNRLDTSLNPWQSADGEGVVLRFSCDTLAIDEVWTVGPNPELAPFPGDAGAFLLRTGDYFDEDYAAKLDGALARLDPTTGDITTLLEEATFGYNLGALAGDIDGHSVLVADDGYAWGVWCVDRATGTATPTTEVDAFIGDAVTTPDGRAWISYRRGYAGSGAPVVEGLVAWDPSTCTADDPVATLFPPYDLALR